MDDFFKDIYVSVFKEWVLSQKIDSIQITNKEPDEIILESQGCIGRVIFNNFHIIELEIENKVNNQKIFYLHFQMNTIHHALKLFKEMVECMLKTDSSSTIKILLSCSGGLTTSYFATLINEMAEKFHYDVHASAVGCENIYYKAQDYDVILLAPQISYMEARIAKLLPDKKILSIPPQVFAKYDCRAILELVYDVFKEKSASHSSTNIPLKIHSTIDNQTLSLAIFRNSNRVHIAYRLYDTKTQILLNKEIIKPTISIQDLYDVIDTVLLQYPDTLDIGIATPGIINDGFIDSSNIPSFDKIPLYQILKERYSQNIYLSNDVNSAAIGYYASQNEYKNIAFLFQPIRYFAGAGFVVDGSLMKGRNNLAGEVQYLPMNLSDDCMKLNRTPEGTVELVSKLILSIISTMAPEVVVLFSQLTSDVDVLYRELEKILPRKYIPEIIKIDDMVEYNLVGQMVLCAQKEMG